MHRGDQHLVSSALLGADRRALAHDPNHHTAQSFAVALRGSDGRTGPFCSVDTKGQKPQFSWNEPDVLNWNTEKPYDF
ncbi:MULTISPECIES: hypothetical protein [unclassified Streptomyces]|uniref:hypothetical protein n=1 Tax=unclassified Streptomyces TaxID=2593676 RepID=UPI00210E0E38|nr:MULTISPECIES: hypothetical protein [unclassified Streptomyces]